MLLKFNDYMSVADMDFNGLGEINESHRYHESINSVMDKMFSYVGRMSSLMDSSLSESAKRIYSDDVRLSIEERVAAVCIINEMVNMFERNSREEISAYDKIIDGYGMLKEDVEYDVSTAAGVLGIDEGIISDIFKKGKGKIKDVIDGVMGDAKKMRAKGVTVVKAKKSDLETWAKNAKKDFEDRYARMKKLLLRIKKNGIDTIRKFIETILEFFCELGDNLVDAVSKLGGLKMEKGEMPVKIGIDDSEGIYRNAKGDDEKNFINNIILRAEAILSKDKENASKLMNESIVDNKFIAWLAGYKQDGTKMSWWKCILIGICASLVVWILPKVLVVAGVGGALSVFIGAFVGVLWNGTGILRLIYKRNKERKDGERFFDKKTAIFFTIAIVANIFSIATFIKTIGPMLAEICNAMGWDGGSNMSVFGEYIFKLARKMNPETAFNPGGFEKEITMVKNNGGDLRSSDLIKSAKDVISTVKKMPGASEANVEALKNFLQAPDKAEGTSAIYHALDKFKDSHDLPLVNVFDTSKWGGSGPIVKAMDFYKDQLPDSAILGTLGSTATQTASHGQYGFVSYITGVNQDWANRIFQKAAEIAGQDMSTLTINTYGTGAISDVIEITKSIQGGFNNIVPDASFLPMVMPFFNDKKWGDYKIRFASATRGSAAYVVDKVEMHDGKYLDDNEIKSDALDTMRLLHEKAWKEYSELFLDEEGRLNESSDNKKIEEPQYILFFIRTNEDTGNENDAPKRSKDDDDEGVAVGVVIDTLTLMCADVCDFNKSVRTRRRPRPYFMKGLLSRLSFRPTKDNDNDTKEYIRNTLGQTMKTIVSQCVLFGMGKKYIESEIKGDKAECSIRSTVYGNDKKKVDPKKCLFELGNFSPEELMMCMSDKAKNNKIPYDFLDGSFASKISIKYDSDNKIKSTGVRKDAQSIENVKYYLVPKSVYDDIMATYEKALKKYNDGGKTGKKPSKPKFVTGDRNRHYRVVSKKFREKYPDRKRWTVFDFVDIKIVPLLKKGELHDTFIEDKTFKKMLYTKDGKLNKDVISVMKPFLFRPEKTFAKDDEYNLKKILNDNGISDGKLGWFKNIFGTEKELYEAFKEMIEIIWDYLADNRRRMYKGMDLKKNHGKTNEGIDDYTVLDMLVEEFLSEWDDEHDDYEDEIYESRILEMSGRQNAMSYSEYLDEMIYDYI